MKSEELLLKRIQELTALYEISRCLASNLDLTSSMNQILGILSEKLSMNRGTITLYDKSQGQLEIKAAHGLTRAEIGRGKYKIGEGVTGRVLETGEAMLIPNIEKEPLFLNRTQARRDWERSNISFICVPIKIKGETLGVLSVDQLFSGKQLTLQDDLRLLSIVASLIGQNLKIHMIINSEKEDLLQENRILVSELKEKYHIQNIVGNSKPMLEIYKCIERIAPMRSTVIIRGESGTGKELIAHAIHYESPRANKPFIKISCAALPEALLESELFGHEKGSYTGAIETVKGRFELADGGTIFLDEIGDISLLIQIKLLRVLQERRFERIGGTKTIASDFRLIVATNRNLEQAVSEGKFREDLYYRLNVVPIFVPPLRNRPEDVPMLLDFFLKKYNYENKTNYKFSSESIEKLIECPWFGNVRELENTIERTLVMAQRSIISADEISLPLKLNPSTALLETRFVDKPQDVSSQSSQNTLQEIEKQKILKVMEQCGWVQVRACQILGITPRQLGYKLKKYKIEYKKTFL
jgi:Nif-specific regulatory protein